METQEKVWPCVECSEEEYNEQIRDKLLEWGYKDCILTWKGIFRPNIVTNAGYIGDYAGGCIGNDGWPFKECLGRYLCPDIPTFLHECRKIAIIRRGCLKPEPTKQQSLDSRYMRMAYIWAENSYCERRKVGALIVKDKMIISDGYNGTPSGFPNVCENEEGSTFSYVLHAEANAITKVAKSTNNCDGATLYVTTSPCIECSKLIIQAGIKRVVYSEEYHNTEGIELLKQAVIEVEKI